MRWSHRVPLAGVLGWWLIAGAVAAAPAVRQLPAAEEESLRDVVFADGFEYGECSLWSASSNPFGAPDTDLDLYGDQLQPTVYCQLPAGFVANWLDCDDSDPDIHPDAPELCNGLDDDCDGATPDGDDDPLVGLACDGDDSDLCEEGSNECVSGAIACSDTTDSTVDLCNGLDDDCDPSSPDGSEDPLLDSPCDGSDGDLCQEGTFDTCAAGVLECSDDTDTTIDLCNGLDDDCDPASADGSEDPLLDTPCDGPDGDLCEEGAFDACVAGNLECNDDTDTTIDLCNGFDDDCDPASADGSEDPLLFTPCDGPDGDECEEGTYTACIAGTLYCTDTTGTTFELCDGTGHDEDCDGEVDEGFDRNDNPLCSEGTYNLGSVSGDTGSQTVTDTYYNEEWDLVTITEDNDGIAYLSATIELYSPPGIDYDLYVYCFSCGGGLAGTSTVHGLSGHYDAVEVRANDDFGADDSHDIIIEVRHYQSNRCAYWELQVDGNTTVVNQTCNP